MSRLDEQLIRVAAFLRKSPTVKTNECIMAEKRVDIFKGTLSFILTVGTSATKALLSPEYAAQRQLPSIGTQEEATAILQELLNAGLILRAKSVNNTRFFQPDLSRTWSDDALYAWIYEGSQFTTLMGAAILLIVVLGAMLFPLWPHAIRSKASWVLNVVMYLAIGCIAFLLGISVVRMIFYVITYFAAKPGIWIFPNLWEDVGVIESFIPLWDWDKPAAVTASSAKTTPTTEERKND
ncbi:Translocation protein Sec62 domain-containing protein [Paramicrosporidium saccamoebae]|uniref:Translocation protein SEC62 n=1 Tax=Paramicrosporidium saccamoebae TaxID=1246581 RepID=A0A2H9TGM1_9FUNG|nr:Translocation protein Sec62 domain-containing protein [Paramicrosporidium saccamoebae]